MYGKFKNKIDKFIAEKFYIKKKENEAVSFANILLNAKRIFVIMPENDDDFNNALKFLEELKNQNKDITLLLKDLKVSLLPISLKLPYIDFTEPDVSKFNIPSKKIIESINEKEFDMVIDLIFEDKIFYYTIISLVKAKFKIGFTKESSDKYYNLQFANTENNSAISYKNLLNSLQMF